MFYRPPGRLQSEMNPSGPLRSGLWNRTGVTTAGWDAPPAIGANRRRAGSPSPARDAHLRHRRTEPEDRRVHPRVERSGRGAPSSDRIVMRSRFAIGCAPLPNRPALRAGNRNFLARLRRAAASRDWSLLIAKGGVPPFTLSPRSGGPRTLAGSPPLVFGTGKCPREGKAGHRRASRGSAKPVPMTLRCANVRAAPQGEPCALGRACARRRRSGRPEPAVSIGRYPAGGRRVVIPAPGPDRRSGHLDAPIRRTPE